MPLQGLQIKTLDDERIIERIKVLDKVCFPVKYGADFYANLGKRVKGDAERHWSPLNAIAIFHDHVVGVITTRLEFLDAAEAAASGKQYRAYVMTLAVLEPYRRLGIATELLKHVASYLESQHDVVELGLNVQQGSTALRFYEKHGFTIRKEMPNYYTDIEPTCDAFYVASTIAHQPVAAGAVAKK
jgi:ribosomal protein S18 acetylase RimI-like enzyme